MLGDWDLRRFQSHQPGRASLGCNSLTRAAATSAVFDDPNLVSSAGLVPVLALADAAGLRGLADEHLSVPTRQGRERRVEGGLAGRRDGRRRRLASTTWRCCGTAGWAGSSTGAYAPSTLGSFLRAFTFGHVRQLDAVASRFLTGLAGQAPLVAGGEQRSGGCWSMSTTRSSRSTATPSRAPGSATPGSAA